MLEELLERARDQAMAMSGPSHGMASVRVSWDPYEAGWEAEANWSDDSRVVSGVSESAVDAVTELISILDETQRAATCIAPALRK